MSTSKFFEIIKRLSSRNKSSAMHANGIPTVEFHASRLTEAVKADVRKNIMLLTDIDRNHFGQVYDAALRSISAGRDLGLLCDALIQINISGMTKRRAAEIARLLNNKTRRAVRLC